MVVLGLGASARGGGDEGADESWDESESVDDASERVPSVPPPRCGGIRGCGCGCGGADESWDESESVDNASEQVASVVPGPAPIAGCTRGSPAS